MWEVRDRIRYSGACGCGNGQDLFRIFQRLILEPSLFSGLPLPAFVLFVWHHTTHEQKDARERRSGVSKP
jgi:hypothetical protein